MSMNLNFRRFDISSKIEGFIYNRTDDKESLQYDLASVTMEKIGFNVLYSVQNYMAQPILIGGNLRTTPKRIDSLRRDGTRFRDGYNNSVVITIHSTDNTAAEDPKKRNVRSHKTEIRIPGKMLNQGSVFISELDCYVMTESHIDATRELIAKDVSHSDWDSINLPESMFKPDPATLYIDHKELAQYCIERQDKINIRVGVDLRYGNIPDIIKTMHVGILDSYFIPYRCYKLVYDPTLGSDEFVIENLYYTSREVYRSTFSELEKLGTVYIDHDETKTIFGKFYGMALFANERCYLDYVHERKSQERFDEETLAVAERSGDPKLKEKISALNREILHLKEREEDLSGQTVNLRKENTELKNTVKEREASIDKLRKNHDERMRAETVLAEIQNDRQRVENEGAKIQNERTEQVFRSQNAPHVHKANTLKAFADIMKTGWGIATACITGVVTVVAIFKKYNIRIAMGP